jgi:tritrans,polycis-undecaprenyl-diphosphate synthase [geranylgeranyl-diphosphate specific]
MIEAFNKLYTDPRVKKYGIQVNILGRYKMFPKPLVEVLDKIIAKTKNNNKFILNFAMAYGGREELVDAIKKIASKKLRPEQITEKVVEENLYTASQPDIIIRTGGERRTSNFLMWQSYYSEWFFLDKTWPEFTKQDFLDVLKEFEQRERRFGR